MKVFSQPFQVVLKIPKFSSKLKSFFYYIDVVVCLNAYKFKNKNLYSLIIFDVIVRLKVDILRQYRW